MLAHPVPLGAPGSNPDRWSVGGHRCGAVQRLGGPHVISGGWWQREVHREYWFAETRRGELPWIYFDRRRRRWFLQGTIE